VLTHLQRKEQEEARLELQKAAQNSRVALDILKLVQSGQIAATDQLHRQAADLQRWRTDMARLLAQGKIEEAKNALQDRIHRERMQLAWAQLGFWQWADGQRFALDQMKRPFLWTEVRVC
jgi:hypothetical protein